MRELYFIRGPTILVREDEPIRLLNPETQDYTRLPAREVQPGHILQGRGRILSIKEYP